MRTCPPGAQGNNDTTVINSDLDIAHWRQELATRGRTQVRDFLQPDAARFLQGLLRDEVPWTLAYRSEDRSQVLRADAVAQLGSEGEAEFIAARAREAKGRYGFAYDSYMMVTAYKEGRDPGLPLHRVLEFFNSPETLAAASVEGGALPELVTEIIRRGQERGEFARRIDPHLAAASFFATAGAIVSGRAFRGRNVSAAEINRQFLQITFSGLSPSGDPNEKRRH